jgi:hypothetical protein
LGRREQNKPAVLFDTERVFVALGGAFERVGMDVRCELESAVFGVRCVLACLMRYIWWKQIEEDNGEIAILTLSMYSSSG